MAIWIYRRQCRWFVGLEDGVEDVSVLILEDSVEAGFVAGVEYGLVEGSIAVEWEFLILVHDDEFQPHQSCCNYLIGILGLVDCVCIKLNEMV